MFPFWYQEQITAAMSEPLVCAWEAGSIEEMDT